jgi:butyrate kinase
MTGIPSIERRSLFHSLSQKAAARKAAGELGINYEEGSFIVSHMGGGISVGAHRRGRVIDVGDAIGGDGPMAPERAGSIPGTQLARLCFDGSYSLEEVLRMFAGGGGVYAHLGTRDMKEVDHRAEQGDEYAALVREALACSVARAIGARAAMLCGQIDCTVFTGGLSQWDRLVRKITEKIEFLAPVKVYTENLEMEALATGVLRVLNGTEEPLRYASSG